MYFQNKNLTHEKLPIFFKQNNYKFKGKKVTKNNMIDVTTIGNAIVDIIAQCSDSYLIEQNIIKSSMNLIDEERSKSLYDYLEKPKIISGGSGNDIIKGQSGEDILQGGFGLDIVDGGDGADVYRNIDESNNDLVLNCETNE